MTRKKVFGHNAAVALGHRYSGKTRDPGERGGMPSKSVRSKNYKASKPSELPLEVAMARKAWVNKMLTQVQRSPLSPAHKKAHNKVRGHVRKQIGNNRLHKSK